MLNVVMTFAQKVYRGISSYTSDIVCNVDQGKVYSGQSRYTSDIIARFDGREDDDPRNSEPRAGAGDGGGHQVK